MAILSETEKNRYHRHLILDEIGAEGQYRISNGSVLVVGAGGLGCPVLQYLTAAGVGKLGVIDADTVDISNLQRQVFFGFHEVGKHKAIVSGAKMTEMNSSVKVEVINRWLEPDNAVDIISDYDLVVDCTDNLETRFLINDVCILLDKPMVHGAIHKYQGQVSVFNYLGGPSYRCLHEEQSNKPLSKQQIMGIYCVVPGIIGTLEANETLKILTGAGRSLSGKLLVYNAFTNEMYQYSILRKEKNFDKKKLTTIYTQAKL